MDCCGGGLLLFMQLIFTAARTWGFVAACILVPYVQVAMWFLQVDTLRIIIV